MDDIGTTYMLMTSEGEEVKTTRNCGQVQTTEGESRTAARIRVPCPL